MVRPLAYALVRFLTDLLLVRLPSDAGLRAEGRLSATSSESSSVSLESRGSSLRTASS